MHMLTLRSPDPATAAGKVNVSSWKPGSSVPRMFHKEKEKGIKFLGSNSPHRMNSPKRIVRRASMCEIIDLKKLILSEKFDLSLTTKSGDK